MESISLDMNFSGFIDPTSDMELDLLSLLDRDRSAYNFDEHNMGAPNGANQDTENMLENFMSMECDTLKLDYMDLDEFLNLNNSACESGILVDDKKVSNSFCEDNSQIDNLSSVRSIECDHPYAMSLSTKDHHGSSSSLCEVTSEHFDSGISSSSGSPQSNRLCNDSPVSIEDSIQPARFTKQVVKTQLDLSDVDLHELAVNCMPDETVSPANRHDSPFICDLTSADSDASQYDAVTGQFGDCDRLSSCGSNDASSDDIPTSQHLFQRPITSDKLLRSLPNFRPLVLTDEESRLLMEEGVSIPTDLPLTKYEEKVLKKVRRKIRNKRSAMASRQKKKDYVDGLEQRVQQCTGLNQSLERRVKELETQNYSLMAQLRKLREVVKTSNHKTTQATSCLMVLMLSLGLFIAPSYGPLSVQKATDQQQQRNVDVHRSRKVLEYKPGSDSPRLIKQPFFPVGGMVVDADVVVEAQPSYQSWSVKEEADHKELVVAMAQTKPEDYELSRTRRSLLENSTLDEKQLAPADAFPPPDVDVGGFDRQAAVPSKTEALATSAPFPVATSGGGDIAMKRVMVATTDAPVAKLRRSEM